MFKCDNETYVRIDSLMRYEVDGPDLVGADVGRYPSGGAGYRISARAVASLLPALEQGSRSLAAGCSAP